MLISQHGCHGQGKNNLEKKYFQVREKSLKIKSASINICTKFSNCQRMKIVISAFQKGLRNRQTSGKSQ